MTLIQRLELLAAAIRNKINTIMPRLLPSGGSANQILTKLSATFYDVGWSKVSNDMLDTMPANTVKANNTAGTATPTDINMTTFKTMLGLEQALVFVIGDGVNAIAADDFVDLPALPIGFLVTGWTITADASGSAVVDIRRATYANYPSVTTIAGTAKPTLSSAQKNTNTTLTGWTTTLVKNDVIRAIVESATTVKRITITIHVTRTS